MTSTERRGAKMAKLLQLAAATVVVGLALAACSSPQTKDLVDRRVNNVMHVFNLD